MSDPSSLANLSLPEKRMLLAQLLREKAQRELLLFPLAHGQRGLWFLYQLDRGSAAYNVYFPVRIRSPLHLPAFRKVVELLIDRHPSLRTTFEERDGELLQRVHDDLPLPLEVIDASSWSEELLGQRLADEAFRPFDLERGPLVRVLLFERSPEDHVVLLAVHHIVGDLWSLAVVFEEMRQLYPALRDGVPLTLPPPTAHYRDFVRWQADLLEGAEGERLGAYWERQLAGVPTVLTLPTDRPRPPRLSHRGSAVPCCIDADLCRRLKELAAREHVTLFTVLLSAFQVVLGRYAGQDDFLIGSPFAGRGRPEFERVVGYFINMLPLRGDLSGDPTFRDLLRRTKAALLGALEHQDYSFPVLVQRLNVPRDPSRTPLVQATFTLEKVRRPGEMGALRFCAPQADPTSTVVGLQAEPCALEPRTCQSDMDLILEEGHATVEGLLHYATDLFDADTIRRLVGHFLNLLEAAVDSPDRRLSELPWLTESEQRQLVHDWNQTRVDYPDEVCLHQLFEHQVERTPAATALIFRDRSLSYAELDAWANRVAERLRRRGVGRGALVGLCFERCPEMLVAILATLKAGAAYVPLDPQSPDERLAVILADIRAPILLAQPRCRDRLQRLGARVMCLEGQESGIRSQGSGVRGQGEPGALATGVNQESEVRSQESGVRPDDLAYVIHTSGSTGRPKGVMVEHRAICNTVLWHQQAQSLHEGDVVLLNLPYHFDASICVIFPTLASGARLVLAEPGEERDPLRLAQRVARDQVTIVHMLPGVLRLLLDAAPLPADKANDPLRSLRWICCGGEVMPPELPARVFERLDAELFNLYGPTETAVDAACFVCRRGERRPVIPIGRPIANTQVYVLDANRRPVPIGVPGELYVGGAGLARGYLNDPELTAEKFIPIADCGLRIADWEAGHDDAAVVGQDSSIRNPQSAIRNGDRLYRTGDRCRWLADGDLEFLDRLDQQVKVRGYRIEVGEIEVALLSHPAVRETAVAVQTDDLGEKRLVAYFKPAGESSSLRGQDGDVPSLLRQHLKARLPEYMMPAVFVPLPALPRTPSGKIDRQALPQPSYQRSPGGASFVPPRTPLEGLLAELWRDMLRVEQVGVADNFFELGGSSLQGAMLVNRLQEKLGRPVSTMTLFDAPTIAGMARQLEATCADRGLPNAASNTVAATPPSLHELLVLLQPSGTQPPLFMVHPPGGIVVCYQALARHLGTERPFYGIRSRGLHGETDLPTRLEDMAAEYVAALRTVQPQGPYHLGGWSMGGVVALEMAQQLRADGQAIHTLAFLDTTIPDGPANQAYAEAVELGAEYGLDITLKELAALGPDKQLPYLWQHVQRLGLVEVDTPLPVVQQILDDLKRLFYHHVWLATEHALRPYPGCITLFRPSEAPVAIATLPDRGWSRLAAGVDVHFVPGHHHTMVKEPQVQVLAEKLRLALRD